MTHDNTQAQNTDSEDSLDAAAPPCPGRRAAMGCALAFGVSSVLAQPAQAATSKFFSAGLPKSFLLNRPRLVKFLGGRAVVYITRLSVTRYQCLWAGCTHESCIVDWSVNHAQFICPCHDSRFARDGRVLRGPARRPLPSLPIKVVSGKVMVDLGPTKLV